MLQTTWPGIAAVDRGLAVDVNHNVYVFVFQEGNQIQRIASDGTPHEAFGSFEIPQAIAAGPDGTLYGTDGSPHSFAVQRFSAGGGNRIVGWGDGFAPIEDGPSADGEFHTPYAIAIAGSKVFVVDGGNHRVQVFDEMGTFLTKWSTTTVRGVAADSHGNVYLYGDGNIEKWAPSTNTPTHSATWGLVKSRWSR
jgi:DNA-binding beta-propeller fold protein YncE